MGEARPASRFPLPVAGLAIQTRRTQDEHRLADALHKLLEEDPCLALEANQTISAPRPR